MTTTTTTRQEREPTMTAETPLISVRDLSVRYGNRTALDGLDLELSGGRIVGLLGENGCGKSTLLKVLAGVYADHTGDVRLAGHRLGPESKALVSYLPDASSLPDSVRVSYCLGCSRTSSPTSTGRRQPV